MIEITSPLAIRPGNASQVDMQEHYRRRLAKSLADAQDI